MLHDWKHRKSLTRLRGNGTLDLVVYIYYRKDKKREAAHGDY